jgi:hypothetical protein
MYAISITDWHFTVLDDNNTNRVAHRHETLSNAISDPIAFHQMLSTFALWMFFKLKYTGGASYLNHDAIIHHNKAIKAVSRRLHDGVGITGEGMIAAVLGFAHHAVCTSTLCEPPLSNGSF